MTKPMLSRRRIEHLKQLAYDCGLTAEEARQHGKLTATATWEKLLLAHGLEFEPKPAQPLDTAILNQESTRQINLTDWIDWSQALALALAATGFALLVLSLFPKVNSLHLLPSVRISIQIGATK